MKITKSIEFKSTDFNEDGRFTGYASVFNGNDYVGDTILKGAFTECLKEATDLLIFFNHETWQMPVGKWLSLEEDEKGLKVQGELTPGNADAEKLLSCMRHGTVKGLSISFDLKKGDYEEKTDGGRIIKRINHLYEISAVTFPCDRNAQIDKKSVPDETVDDIETVRDFERTLRDVGFSKTQAKAMCAKARALFVTQWDAEEEEKKQQELVERILKLGQ